MNRQSQKKRSAYTLFPWDEKLPPKAMRYRLFFDPKMKSTITDERVMRKFLKSSNRQSRRRLRKALCRLTRATRNP